MAKLILHIGGHRTGSTSIQKSLCEGRERLRECGVLYPETGLITVAHHLLGFSLGNHVTEFNSQEIPKIEALLADLAGEVADPGCETVLMSSETLCELHPKRGDSKVHEGLQRFFTNFDEVRILHFVRHQVPLLESRYKFETLWVRSALTMAFPEYVQFRMVRSPLGYLEQEQFFRSVRPDIAYEFVSFAEASKTGSLIRHFYQRSGITDAYTREVQINESLSRDGTLAIWMWNRGMVPSGWTREEFVAWARQTFPEPQDSLYDADLLEAVAARYAASNAELLAHKGIDLGVELAEFRQKYRLCGSTPAPEFEAQLRDLPEPSPEPPMAELPPTPAPPPPMGWKTRLRRYLSLSS